MFFFVAFVFFTHFVNAKKVFQLRLCLHQRFYLAPHKSGLVYDHVVNLLLINISPSPVYLP